MGEPYIGKESDILNKIAVAALFQGRREEAEEYWLRAIEFNPKHFDTRVNYAMYQWKYGEITDNQLKENLEEHVFNNKHKGHSLYGIINIAIGEKAEGLSILSEYNHQQKASTITNDPSENIRRRKAREYAKEVFEEVNVHRNEYFQNVSCESGHKSKIDSI